MVEDALFAVQVAHPGESQTVVAAAGELDVSTAGILREPLLRALASAVVVLDLSACTFCDSSGLSLIVEAWQHAGLASCAFRVAGAVGDGTVARAFALAGAEDFLDMFPDVAAALKG